MKKIAIIGSAGAGKSTLARQLGKILNIEVIHLDSFYWKPGWIETSEDEWKDTVKNLVKRETWIIDGNYGSTLDIRLDAADTIIFLDFPRIICLWRVIKRRFQYAGKSRPDMTPGCIERLTWSFIHWVWTYPIRSRSKVLEKLAERAEKREIIILHTFSETHRFLQDIKQSFLSTLSSEQHQ